MCVVDISECVWSLVYLWEYYFHLLRRSFSRVFVIHSMNRHILFLDSNRHFWSRLRFKTRSAIHFDWRGNISTQIFIIFVKIALMHCIDSIRVFFSSSIHEHEEYPEYPEYSEYSEYPFNQKWLCGICTVHTHRTNEFAEMENIYHIDIT